MKLEILLLAFVLGGCASTAKSNSADKIVTETIGIDAHNHVDLPLNVSELPGPKLDLAGEMKRSGLTAIGMTFALDYQKLSHPDEAYERFLAGMKAADTLLEQNKMSRALTADDVVKAHREQRSVVIQAVEGAHFLNGKIERVKQAYDLGLRHIGILHDSDASVPLGDVYTNPPRFGGLTKFGAEVVRESERLGMLVDLAHCDDRTVEMVLKIAKHPVIISHTGLNTRLGNDAQFAERMKPRLICAETAKKVAAQGGLVCVWTHLADNADEYAKNIRALVDVMGVDHVCLGTDTKMTPTYHPRGPARVGERTNEAWANERQGFYFAVVAALLKEGFTKEEIAKIGGGNYLRVFAAATETARKTK